MKIRTKPFPYQEESVDKIEGFQGRALLALPMGAGKSLVSLLYALRHPELRPIVIVCPASLKWNWAAEALKHAGMSCEILEGMKPDTKARIWKPNTIWIINYDILGGWLEFLKALEPRLVILDECFPPETKILTESGELPIGDIVEGKIKTKVACRNLISGEVVFRNVVKWIKIPRTRRLVTIHHASGSLTCTENHELWIEGKGYVEAGKVTRGDALCLVQRNTPDAAAGRERREVLRQELFGQVEDASARSSEEGLHGRTVREDVRRHQEILPVRRWRGSKEGDFREDVNTASRNERHDRQEVTSDQETQGNPSCLVGWSWGQRDGIPQGEIAPRRSGKRMVDADDRLHRAVQSLPHELQDRHRQREVEGGDRTGRAVPLRGQEGEGQEETVLLGISRVVDIEIQEQGNRPGSETGGDLHPFVYCIEVEEHHNFFAEGVLVHNCIAIKSRGAKRTKHTKLLCKRVDHVLALSGTPLTNRPAELWNVLNLLRPDVWRSFYEYASTHCNLRRTPWGVDYSGAKALPELHKSLKKHVMVRYHKEDILKDLPPKTRQVVSLPLSDEGEYQEAVNDFVGWMRNRKGKITNSQRAEQITKLMALKQLAARLKLPAVLDFLDAFLQESDEKIIVFGHHREIVDTIHERYQKNQRHRPRRGRRQEAAGSF